MWGLRADGRIGWSGHDVKGEREPALPSWGGEGGPPLQQGSSAAQKCELRRECSLLEDIFLLTSPRCSQPQLHLTLSSGKCLTQRQSLKPMTGSYNALISS